MINWEKTKAKYGYTKREVVSRKPVIVECMCGYCFEVKWFRYREAVINSRLCTSCTSKKNWKSEKYRTNHVASMSSWAIKNNIKPVTNPSVAARIGWADPRYREKIVRSSTENWKDEEYRKNQIEKQRKVWTDDKKKKFGEWSRKMWENKEFVQKFCAGREKMKARRSNIEIIFANMLRELDIKFSEQKAIGPYLFDFLVKDKILVDLHGNYWHNLNRVVKRDQSKITYYEKYLKGAYDYKVIWEHEFGCLDRIRHLLLYWLGEPQELIDYNIKSSEMCKIGRDEASLFIALYHYIGKIGTSDLIYGFKVNDSLAALVAFSKPTRKESATRLGYKSNEVRELSRLVIHPSYQKKNFASHIISKAIKAVKNDCPGVKCLLSFADSTFNHSGIIYKAAGWQFDGKSPRTYWYASDDGWVIHKKTLYAQAIAAHMKETEFAEKHGYKKIYGGIKYRYTYRFKNK